MFTTGHNADIVVAQYPGETEEIGHEMVAEMGMEGGGHSAGMPQLDFATYAPQLIWLAITFGVLYVLMARVALPRVATALEQRRDRIANDLDQAAQSKRETEEAIEAYETALAEARAKAHEIASKTREELAKETDAHRQKLEAELDAKLETAEARIAETKQTALGHVKTVATDVAAAVLAQLGETNVDADRIARAVEAEMNG